MTSKFFSKAIYSLREWWNPRDPKKRAIATFFETGEDEQLYETGLLKRGPQYCTPTQVREICLEVLNEIRQMPATLHDDSSDELKPLL
jgi:hypothetical protein